MMLAAILCTLFGATAQVPGRIKAYLVAVCAAAPVLWIGDWLLGETSFGYALEYAAVTMIILLTILAITFSEKMTVLTAVIGSCIAILMILLTYGQMPRPVPFYDWFYLAEGAILGGCGASLLFQSWQLPRKDIYAALALLWLLQAAFRLEFALNAKETAWLWLNQHVPQLLVCAAFLWIGTRARVVKWCEQ